MTDTLAPTTLSRRGVLAGAAGLAALGGPGLGAADRAREIRPMIWRGSTP